MLLFTSIFFIRFEIIREFWKIVENFDINQWSYFIRNRWNFRFLFSTIIKVFQFSFSKDLLSFENFQFTDRILSTFFLYKIKIFVLLLLFFMSNKSKRLKNRIALKRLKRLKKIDILFSIVIKELNTFFEIILKANILSNESFSSNLKIFVEKKWNLLFYWIYDVRRSFETWFFDVTFRMNNNFAKIIDKIFRRKYDFSFVKNFENQIMIFILDNKNENSHDNFFETNFRVFAHFFEKSFVLCDTDDVKFRIAFHSEITSIQNFERHYTYFDLTV